MKFLKNNNSFYQLFFKKKWIKKEIKTFVQNYFFDQSKKTKKTIIYSLIKINKETNYSFFNIFNIWNNFFQKNNFSLKENFFIYYLALYGIIFFKNFNFKTELFFYFKKIISFNKNFNPLEIKKNFTQLKNISFFSFLDYYLQLFSSLSLKNLKNILKNTNFFNYYFLIYSSLMFIFIGYFHKYLVIDQEYKHVVFFLEIMQKNIKYSKKINLYHYNSFIKNLNSLLPKNLIILLK